MSIYDEEPPIIFDEFYQEKEGEQQSEKNGIDFYAILNIPRNATIEDINKAFKQRSLIFHPDRHLSEDDRREATKIFVEIKRAHEVLSDPMLRAIYDTTGVRGIDLEGWRLVERTTKQEHIRREYEFLRRLHENEVMLERVKPASMFLLRSSIAGMFARAKGVEKFSLLGMRMGQGVDCAFGTSDRIGLAGSILFNERGLGKGNVLGSYNWMASPSMQLKSSLAFGPTFLAFSPKLSLTVPANKQKWLSWLTGSSFLLQPTIQYNTTRADFDFVLSPVAAFKLHDNNQGSISLNLGVHRYPSLTLSYVHMESIRPKLACNVTISPVSPSLQLTYHKRFLHNELHCKASCVFAANEVSPSITVERRLSRYSKVRASLLFSYPMFLLQASFSIRTSLNVYEFSVVLCDQQENIVLSSLCGVLLPCLLFNASKVVFSRSFARLWELLNGKQLDDEASIVELKKEQAHSAVNLMRESAEKIAHEELRRNGLIIVEALYGQLKNEGPGSEQYPLPGENLLDVTIPLQAYVNDSTLHIYSGKDQIPGFYDPCPGEPKMLKVLYRFEDKLHSVTVVEEQPLVLPSSAHLVSQEANA